MWINVQCIEMTKCGFIRLNYQNPAVKSTHQSPSVLGSTRPHPTISCTFHKIRNHQQGEGMFRNCRSRLLEDWGCRKCRKIHMFLVVQVQLQEQHQGRLREQHRVRQWGRRRQMPRKQEEQE
ncbi:hypothetical protein BDU57DRAFT_524831 [Ampelomyces quisqualis]|uniref:Uncharacterized protein n=1 Tax=Ampelomyces quisqualis TaxID=50730 RepID=A0A6A5Q8K5_AMPQU|nr:hypothetical protein BDU57DRAFT_524831 [Ampelomyces quisqualis]